MELLHRPDCVLLYGITFLRCLRPHFLFTFRRLLLRRLENLLRSIQVAQFHFGYFWQSFDLSPDPCVQIWSQEPFEQRQALFWIVEFEQAIITENHGMELLSPSPFDGQEIIHDRMHEMEECQQSGKIKYIFKLMFSTYYDLSSCPRPFMHPARTDIENRIHLLEQKLRRRREIDAELDIHLGVARERSLTATQRLFQDNHYPQQHRECHLQYLDYPFDTDDVLIRKYQNGTKAKEYYNDLKIGHPNGDNNSQQATPQHEKIERNFSNTPFDKIKSAEKHATFQDEQSRVIKEKNEPINPIVYDEKERLKETLRRNPSNLGKRLSPLLKSASQNRLSRIGSAPNFKADALLKIDNRLKLSKLMFEDSQFRNLRHETDHLHKTYEHEVRQRKDVREKINNHPAILRKHAMVTA